MSGESLLRLALIGAGGAAGAVLRFAVSSWVQTRSGSIVYPLGTLSVNLTGCLLIGLLSGLADNRSMFSAETRSFLIIGGLGAFTTFSTFGNETLNLLRAGRLELALLNIGAQVVFGLALVWLGRMLAGLWG
ncbi:MAG: fluoride efflux transporter CrcB [Candidatus Electronema sp. V4]|uniref:fluoride efflux transporter CrcB n=1 Tax=Candidatus Electronema sp. V4 TaxID=3454756 RepID=UPI00405590EB